MGRTDSIWLLTYICWQSSHEGALLKIPEIKIAAVTGDVSVDVHDLQRLPTWIYSTSQVLLQKKKRSVLLDQLTLPSGLNGCVKHQLISNVYGIDYAELIGMDTFKKVNHICVELPLHNFSRQPCSSDKGHLSVKCHKFNNSRVQPSPSGSGSWWDSCWLTCAQLNHQYHLSPQTTPTAAILHQLRCVGTVKPGIKAAFRLTANKESICS